MDTSLANQNALISEKILEQLSLAVVLINRQNQITFVNQAAALFLGSSRKKLLGQNLFSLPIHHSFPEALLTKLWQSEQPFVDYEVDWVFIDGRHHLSDVDADFIIFESEPVCLLQIKINENLRKITLEKTQKHHISASRHLIKNLAHEIKNPLGGIRGAAQLLARSLDRLELKEYTQMIIDQSDRLSNLVDRLLGPNKLPRRQFTNIHVVIDRVLTLLNIDLPAHAQLIRDYDPSLPLVAIDDEQIEQAVLNIGQNAVQASASRIIFKTRYESLKNINDQPVKRVIKVSIIDNGAGISEDMKSTLFYPLITNKNNGNGLGLSISQTLVEQHNGHIELSSNAEQTEFSIYIPVGKES